MKLIEGRLDYSKPWAMPDVYCFTGNRTMRKDGALVMGRGAARQIRDQYPGLDHEIGKALGFLPAHRHIMAVPMGGTMVLLWFQVKHHWADEADLTLISEAALQLTETAWEHPSLTFHLNAPGIGNGRLSWNQVEPLLRCLPDNVLVYKV